MFRKIIRGIIVFIFYAGLIIYVLVYYLFSFFINLFVGTKMAKFISLIQKGLERYTENTTVKIIKQLEKMDLWP